ncbi:MAG: type III-B CRISPR module-associated Cmr3 family protein [Nostoc sp. S4]|nr:type III-B CRISPR module-associated Cmr3 family protein [Nostoc sp. S4]
MFEFLIIIEALGFLYGSAGRFLEAENIVGRSGTSFPPSTATVSGLYAATIDTELIASLQLAGPFWAYSNEPQNFYVPLPFNYLLQDGEIKHILHWNSKVQEWQTETGDFPTGKFDRGDRWITIKSWHQPQQVHQNPWKYLPHLHPRLELQQRKLDTHSDRSNLFLENAVQMYPDTCLIYLSNTPLNDGWYRFGGEGHMVDVRCVEIACSTQRLFNQPVGKLFALITPAVWGSTRLSYSEPMTYEDNNWELAWDKEAMLTERPKTFRYRLGGSGKTKRLSRGRYAVPSGSVYLLKESLKQPWHKWPELWFPTEAYNFKRWGCGLALALGEENSS